uniref:Retrotransposon protein, putative, Ty3-gypsy sub-class n=2 Tax=Oryza sativa subsp. japonica TaxID=39947 RepID=Q2R7V1_ORYSJ|nr:retrotransposon protein, putative, Ty3-gypsy sub-class [Oryza sativa Japonica Group]ABA92407.1 retrotransposon protein, putative, Ty3-gypsy subclass [Oryza sativa Japonica Group]
MATARARERVAGDGIRRRRRQRKSDAKAAAADGGNDRRRRRARAAATHGDTGKERKGEEVLTGGDGGDRRRGATEGGRHAADGDRDDLKNEKKKIREGKRDAALTVAPWEWRSGGGPRRRRGGRGDLGHANPTAATARLGRRTSGCDSRRRDHQAVADLVHPSFVAVGRRSTAVVVKPKVAAASSSTPSPSVDLPPLLWSSLSSPCRPQPVGAVRSRRRAVVRRRACAVRAVAGDDVTADVIDAVYRRLVVDRLDFVRPIWIDRSRPFVSIPMFPEGPILQGKILKSFKASKASHTDPKQHFEHVDPV